MLKNEYFEKGGNDPEILAQMRELEYEAQKMQAMQMRPPNFQSNVSSFVWQFWCVVYFSK